MPATLSPKLVKLLACPDCVSNLSLDDAALSCASCGRDFEVRNGIPLLYPAAFDHAHLAEEENLAEMMLRKSVTPREVFRQEQWRIAREQLWSLVSAEVGESAGTIVNLGCGRDPWLKYFSTDRGICVSLDVVFGMLKSRKQENGAEHCVAGDVTALPLKPSSFDCVVCADVIHHLGDGAPDVLRSIFSILKPGGVLYLQDPNAWGLLQFHKSILLPRPVHRFLRTAYHKARHSKSKPADYEFSTSVWKVAAWLRDCGFAGLTFYPNDAYPSAGRLGHGLFRLLGKSRYARTYHGYHYTIRARKPGEYRV